jgi:hypothetical protein
MMTAIQALLRIFESRLDELSYGGKSPVGITHISVPIPSTYLTQDETREFANLYGNRFSHVDRRPPRSPYEPDQGDLNERLSTEEPVLDPAMVERAVRAKRSVKRLLTYANGPERVDRIVAAYQRVLCDNAKVEEAYAALGENPWKPDVTRGAFAQSATRLRAELLTKEVLWSGQMILKIAEREPAGVSEFLQTAARRGGVRFKGLGNWLRLEPDWRFYSPWPRAEWLEAAGKRLSWDVLESTGATTICRSTPPYYEGVQISEGTNCRLNAGSYSRTNGNSPLTIKETK